MATRGEASLQEINFAQLIYSRWWNSLHPNTAFTVATNGEKDVIYDVPLQMTVLVIPEYLDSSQGWIYQ